MISAKFTDEKNQGRIMSRRSNFSAVKPDQLGLAPILILLANRQCDFGFTFPTPAEPYAQTGACVERPLTIKE